ncbi:MAG: FAD-dependent thymidylate synthase [Deltaproteobacteria bacterium]|nr:FAD-dependent thymidylate synthase [Deltaproteobacteria bacterium]MBN2674572.1 FAD-dependent thymidylate synthase [Deltaproteobacteria bacterium]
MKVILAGYNIDSQVIEEAEAAGISKEKLTPEVLSAAYARISRNPAPVNELRQAALNEVSKARKSNRKIIFGMGHHSVAEHAVFNFDILGLSRLAIEELEHFRLCSFTEKSQRYITLENDYVMPVELADTPFAGKLEKLIEKQAAVYGTLHAELFKRLEEKHPDLVAKKSSRNMVDGWAKEDARYATLLCTSGQLGFTANARNLELIVKRLNGSKLTELRKLANHFYSRGTAVAPSILLFTTPSPYDNETPVELQNLAADALRDIPETATAGDAVLVNFTTNGDRVTAAAILCAASDRSFDSCKSVADSMTEPQLKQVFETAFSKMEFFDTPPREFEHVHFTFDVSISAASFGQLKRHRMMSQSSQRYNPSLGITVPPAVREAGMEKMFVAHAEDAEKLYTEIKSQLPDIAPYALTNAHRKRVLVTTNLRDLYHFCRLREDAHAQWDIRILASLMRKEAEKVMPMASMLLCGKDFFVERFEKVFNRKPTIDPANPPKIE